MLDEGLGILLALALRETFADVKKVRAYKPEVVVQMMMSKIVAICEAENERFDYNEFHRMVYDDRVGGEA